LKVNNLEKYIYDDANSYIKPKDQLSTLLTNTEETSTRTFFINLQNQKKEEIRSEINKNTSQYLLAIYHTDQRTIPQQVMLTYASTSNKQKEATAHNAKMLRNHNEWVEFCLPMLANDNVRQAFSTFQQLLMDSPMENLPNSQDPFDRSPYSPLPINWSYPEFNKFLENQFRQQYETYFGDGNTLPLEGINNKLTILGQEIAKNNYVTAQKQRHEQHDKTYEPIINQLHLFFTLVIQTDSPQIATYMHNHQFTKAWHHLLVEELVTNDTSQSIVKPFSNYHTTLPKILISINSMIDSPKHMPSTCLSYGTNTSPLRQYDIFYRICRTKCLQHISKSTTLTSPTSSLDFLTKSVTTHV
jgi:hypothetical protein